MRKEKKSAHLVGMSSTIALLRMMFVTDVLELWTKHNS